MIPGSTVICINDQFNDNAKQRLSEFPKKGYSYRVKEIIPDPLGKLPPGLVLEDLCNPRGWVPCKHGLVLVEYSFRADRFSPVDHREEPVQLHLSALQQQLDGPALNN